MAASGLPGFINTNPGRRFAAGPWDVSPAVLLRLPIFMVGYLTMQHALYTSGVHVGKRL